MYLEALKLNPSYANAYYNLGCCLSVGELVRLPDGRSMNALELRAEAAALNARSASSATGAAGASHVASGGGGSGVSAISTVNACAGCGAAAGDKRCARCKAAYYCSAVCQRAHWTLGGHKAACLPATASAAAAASNAPDGDSESSRAPPAVSPLPHSSSRSNAPDAVSASVPAAAAPVRVVSNAPDSVSAVTPLAAAPTAGAPASPCLSNAPDGTACSAGTR